MSNILSRLFGQSSGGLLGGQQVLPQGFMGPVQPPVQGPPQPTFVQNLNQGTKKLAETPGFANALSKLGTTLLTAREQGRSPGLGLALGAEGFLGQLQAAQAAQQAAAQQKLQEEYLKAQTGQAQASAIKTAREAQMLGQPETISPYQQQQLAIEQAKLDIQRQVNAQTISEKQAKAETERLDREAKKVDEKFNIEQSISSADQVSTQVDELLSHPGFSSAVGYSLRKSIPFTGDVDLSLPGGGFAQGSDAAGFAERLKQLKGGAFLQARQQLKGAGAISDTESNKAESATTRMSLATDEKEFRAAAAEYKDIIQKGQERLRQKAMDKGLFQSLPSGVTFEGWEKE